jgi:hypothetical protein
LLPAGRTEPFSARPPDTQNVEAIVRPSYGAACAGVKRARTLAR